MSLFACPKCQHPISRVTRTREREDGTVLRRSRFCEECDHQWITEERAINADARCSLDEPSHL